MWPHYSLHSPGAREAGGSRRLRRLSEPRRPTLWLSGLRLRRPVPGSAGRPSDPARVSRGPAGRYACTL